MQCPISGGPAVYRARSLYFYIDPEMTYNDEAECLLNGYILRKGRSAFSRSKIFPNPTSTEVTLVYNVSDQSTVEILDEVSRSLRLIKLDPKATTINFSVGMLENGIYTYRILNQTGEITDIGKFVVLK